RTPGVRVVTKLAIQVQDRTGSRSPVVSFDPVQSEHLSLGVRLDPYCDAFGVRIACNRRAGRVHLPGSKGVARPARGRQQQHERKGSHEKIVFEIPSRNQSRRVVKGCYTFAWL